MFNGSKSASARSSLANTPLTTLWREVRIALCIGILHFPAIALLLNFNQTLANNAIKWDSWCRWDCQNYFRLTPLYEPGAFLPAWPLLARFWSFILNSLFAQSSVEIALVSLSILLTILGNRLVLSLYEQLPGERNSTKKFLNFSYAAWVLLIVLNFFPQSFFWVAGFSEPLLFCLTVAGILFRGKNRTLSNIFIGLTAVTRPQGFWIAATWGLMLFWERIRHEPRVNRALIVGTFFDFISVSLPFILFCGWLYMMTNDPFYFLAAQRQWGHEFSFMKWLGCHIPRLNIDFCLLVFAWYTFFKWRKRSFEFKFLALVGVLTCEAPLFLTGFISWTRYQSGNLALFISFTEIIMQSPWILIGFLCYSVPNLAIKIASYSRGAWEG